MRSQADRSVMTPHGQTSRPSSSMPLTPGPRRPVERMGAPSAEVPLPGRSAARAVVEGLELHGVPFVFGIPGAKIDAVFDALLDHSPTTIVCRHEQNAAFMAAAVGRLTGRPGVCIATSGPGASNLVTGLATATTEGDPVVAIVGAVSKTRTTCRKPSPTRSASPSMAGREQSSSACRRTFRRLRRQHRRSAGTVRRHSAPRRARPSSERLRP